MRKTVIILAWLATIVAAFWLGAWIDGEWMASKETAGKWERMNSRDL